MKRLFALAATPLLLAAFAIGTAATAASHEKKEGGAMEEMKDAAEPDTSDMKAMPGDKKMEMKEEMKEDMTREMDRDMDKKKMMEMDDSAEEDEDY